MSQNQIESLRAAPVEPFHHLIDGQSVPASDGGSTVVVSPIDGTRLTTYARGTVADTEAAITAARRAFDDGRWSDMAPAARKKILLNWADLIDAHAVELAVLGVRENGTEIGMALKAEPLSAAATLRYYAEAISLPMYASLGEDQQDQCLNECVTGVLHNAFAQSKAKRKYPVTGALYCAGL